MKHEGRVFLTYLESMPAEEMLDSICHESYHAYQHRLIDAYNSVDVEYRDIQKLTPTLVNTLIKKIEIFNSVKGEDGKKHVPITIHFRSVDIVTVPDEEEIIAAMEEIRNNPTKVA